MEGEIVFYDQRALDEWEPHDRSVVEAAMGAMEDTISPLGQLYAKWNADNRKAIEEYDRRRAYGERQAR